MNYNVFQDLNISSLGFGSMKLPCNAKNSSRIDEKKLSEMVDYAIENGVNYFDTAWGYHDAKAAAALGKALSKHPRNKYFLANKFPGYNPEHMNNAKEIFEKQLKDCCVDHFDFYLMHDVDDSNVDAYTDPDSSAMNYFIEMKKEGKIGHLGFSTYAEVETIERFLDAYPDDIEFCQIPLNYMRWAVKSVKSKVACLKHRGIPIWAMEPLNRGSLMNLSEAEVSVLKTMRPDSSVAAWAFGFVQSVTTVKTVISDMTEMEHLKENISIFSGQEGFLNSKEGTILMGIAEGILSDIK